MLAIYFARSGWALQKVQRSVGGAIVFENFFDLSKPVGADETWVSIFVVVFLMWMGYKFLKKQAKKH